MKKNTPWLLIIAGMMIAIVLLVGSRSAMADPEASSDSTYSHLPFITSPAPPPKIKLIPFATDFKSDTITAIVHAGDNRLFVVERWGTIVIVNPDGTYSGMVVDFLEALNKKLGTDFGLRIYEIPQLLEKARAKEVDGILNLHPEYADKLGLLKTRAYWPGYPAVSVILPYLRAEVFLLTSLMVLAANGWQ